MSEAWSTRRIVARWLDTVASHPPGGHLNVKEEEGKNRADAGADRVTLDPRTDSSHHA